MCGDGDTNFIPFDPAAAQFSAISSNAVLRLAACRSACAPGAVIP